MRPEDIMRHEVSQSQEDKYWIILLTCGTQTRQVHAVPRLGRFIGGERRAVVAGAAGDRTRERLFTGDSFRFTRWQFRRWKVAMAVQRCVC